MNGCYCILIGKFKGSFLSDLRSGEHLWVHAIDEVR